MPERADQAVSGGGESPSAKQLFGLSGICRVDPVQASHRNGKLPSIERGHQGRWHALPGSARSRRSVLVLDISDRTDKIERQWVVQCILA